MKHTKGTSLSILCLPVHKMADCNRFLQCYSRHAYARLQEKLRGLEVSCRNNRQARTQHPWSGTRRSRPRRPVSRAAPPSTMTARDRPGPRRRRRPYTRAHRRDRRHRRRRWRTWRRRRKRRWRRRIKSPWPRRPPSSFERALDGIRTGSQGDTRRCIPSVCRAAPARCWRSQSRLRRSSRSRIARSQCDATIVDDDVVGRPSSSSSSSSSYAEDRRSEGLLRCPSFPSQPPPCTTIRRRCRRCLAVLRIVVPPYASGGRGVLVDNDEDDDPVFPENGGRRRSIIASPRTHVPSMIRRRRSLAPSRVLVVVNVVDDGGGGGGGRRVPARGLPSAAFQHRETSEEGRGMRHDGRQCEDVAAVATTTT